MGTTSEFVQNYPYTARAMIMAILEASKYIDTAAHREKVAKVIAEKSYVNAHVDVIEGRFLGKYDNGAGKTWDDPNFMKFYGDGYVNYPYLSDGMWFLTQHKRWGLLKENIDYLVVAKQINRIDIYKQAADQLKVPLPSDPLRSSTLMDAQCGMVKIRRKLRFLYEREAAPYAALAYCTTIWRDEAGANGDGASERSMHHRSVLTG